MMIPFAGLRSALRLLLNQQEKKRAGNICCSIIIKMIMKMIINNCCSIMMIIMKMIITINTSVTIITVTIVILIIIIWSSFNENIWPLKMYDHHMIIDHWSSPGGNMLHSNGLFLQVLRVLAMPNRFWPLSPSPPLSSYSSSSLSVLWVLSGSNNFVTSVWYPTVFSQLSTVENPQH